MGFLFPATVNQQITDTATKNDQADFANNKPLVNDKALVEEGILGANKSLGSSCGVFLIGGILNHFGLAYCPEVVNLANQNTNQLHDKANALALTRRPSSVQLVPDKADCVLQDGKSANDSTIQTGGNQKINDVNVDSRTNYISDMPTFSNLQYDPNAALKFAGVNLNDDRSSAVQKDCQLTEQVMVPGALVGKKIPCATPIP